MEWHHQEQKQPARELALSQWGFSGYSTLPRSQYKQHPELRSWLSPTLPCIKAFPHGYTLWQTGTETSSTIAIARGETPCSQPTMPSIEHMAPKASRFYQKKCISNVLVILVIV